MTDEELQAAVRWAEDWHGPAGWSVDLDGLEELTGVVCRAILVLHAEIRRHRAAQLTAEDRQSLEFAREAVLGHLARVGDEAACMHALDVLDRLLAAEKP